MPGRVPILLLAFVLISGCVTDRFAPIESTNTPLYDMVKPTRISTPTTPLSAEPSLEGVTNIPSTSPTASTPIQCQNLLPAQSDNMLIQGAFLLKPNYPVNSLQNPYLLNPLDKSRDELPYSEERSIDNMVVSPDGQWVAYLSSPKVQKSHGVLLVVSDLHGNIVYEKNVGANRIFRIDTWLNNQTILLERYQYNPDVGIIDTPLPVSILNPFTGEYDDLESNFPDMPPFFEPAFPWDVFGGSGTGYDPTLTLVAYAKKAPEGSGEFIVLWDLQTNQVIAAIRAAPGFGNGPIWAPDGSRFISDALPSEFSTEDLYSVSRTGEVNRLTYFADLYQSVSISEYTWSPTGNKIAFWLDTETINMGPDLAILDLENNIITILCNQGLPYLRPVWSPDGQRLLVGLTDNTFTNGVINVSTYLIDLSEMTIMEIAKDTFPLGWMIAPEK